MDIWSFGVCLVEILRQKIPNHRSKFKVNLLSLLLFLVRTYDQFQKAMFLVACEGIVFEEDNKLKASPDLLDMIDKCLQKDPKSRPTAKELLNVIIYVTLFIQLYLHKVYTILYIPFSDFELLKQHPFLARAASKKELRQIMPAIFLSNTMTKQGLL